MKQTFDYLENVTFAATVCDKEGIVLYQNSVARKRDGDVTGQNLYNCHGEKSAEKIRQMMASGRSNTYEIIHHGQHYLIHHTPWFSEPGGELSGLIELEIPIPENHPTFDRDKA
ncbi:MAG: PAS sensor protein [Muribaculaceae bacterium]|nr:PAS sensor protein [Muribaculaceae bacterium]